MTTTTKVKRQKFDKQWSEIVFIGLFKFQEKKSVNKKFVEGKKGNFFFLNSLNFQTFCDESGEVTVVPVWNLSLSQFCSFTQQASIFEFLCNWSLHCCSAFSQFGLEHCSPVSSVDGQITVGMVSIAFCVFQPRVSTDEWWSRLGDYRLFYMTHRIFIKE